MHTYLQILRSWILPHKPKKKFTAKSAQFLGMITKQYRDHMKPRTESWRNEHSRPFFIFCMQLHMFLWLWNTVSSRVLARQICHVENVYLIFYGLKKIHKIHKRHFTHVHLLAHPFTSNNVIVNVKMSNMLYPTCLSYYQYNFSSTLTKLPFLPGDPALLVQMSMANLWQCLSDIFQRRHCQRNATEIPDWCTNQLLLFEDIWIDPHCASHCDCENILSV